MSGGIAPWRSLTPAQRTAALTAYDELLDACCEARRAGWLPHERDPIGAAARSLGVWVWPALADRINREAVELEATP